MIKTSLSRYHPRYVRSLVYMLQSTEYNAREYLDWLHRTQNFLNVERRKQLTKSFKALLLLSIGTLLWILLCIVGTGLVILSEHLIWRAIGVVIVVSSPFILGYLILAPLILIRVLVQKPIESVIIYRATKAIASHPGKKIGIAGSFGKTSMREVVRTVLSADLTVAAPPYSHNTALGIAKFAKTLTGKEHVLVFEFGEYYPGDVAKLCKMVKPDIGIITGINEAHLKKFKTLDRTTETIFELADAIPNGPIYINGESKLARNRASEADFVYSRAGIQKWQTKNTALSIEGTQFVLHHDGVRTLLSSQLLGAHQIGPLVAAFHIGKQLGISNEQLAVGVSCTKPFEHRLEPKTDTHGVTTLDDSYNGNPDGVRAVINFLTEISANRFYVTPGLVEMGSRTESVHKEIGKQLVESGIENVVLIRNSVTPYIERGLQEANYSGRIIWFEDALTAYSALPNLTVPGDVILLQNDWPDQYA